MKEYEVYSSLKVPKNSKIIVRLDGRSFHQLARDLNLTKPYDDNLLNKILHHLSLLVTYDSLHTH